MLVNKEQASGTHLKLDHSTIHTAVNSLECIKLGWINLYLFQTAPPKYLEKSE